uniref:Uncharacterized protein n=1 Tax=Fagus sylvatica TaxID=28930 RepID=A0A2N9IN07_FAGSY
MTPSSAPASVAFLMPAIEKVTLNHKVSPLGPDWHLQLKNGAETPSQEEAWSVNCEAKVRCVSHRRCQTHQYVSDIVCMAEDSDVVFMEPLDMVIPSEAGTALITDA